MSTLPAMSIVLVALTDYSSIRRVVRYLRAQTIREQLELILVAPDAAALTTCPPEDLQGFYSVRHIFAGAITDREVASTLGIVHAAAPVVALVENHAYPDPEWAACLVEAHAGPWAAVGPAVLNGNPGILSWTNMLLSYGGWPESRARGEVSEIALHNSSFKRDILLSYGPRLSELLTRSGGLLERLRADGHRLLFEPRARIHHVNPSTLMATLHIRVKAGQLYAATRASSESWSAPKRMLYALGSPMLPAIRLATTGVVLFGGRRGTAALQLVPHLLAGLVLDAAGQMMGYAFGPGNTADDLAHFELVRFIHLNALDQRTLAD